MNVDDAYVNPSVLSTTNDSTSTHFLVVDNHSSGQQRRYRDWQEGWCVEKIDLRSFL